VCAVRTVDDGRRHVLKPLVDPDVRSSVRRDSLDLRHTSLDMGVTVLMARSKTSSGQPAMLGHHTAKALVGETTMNADALPPDIDPESRCRLPLPNRDDLDEAGKQTFDLLSDPHDGSLAGLRGPGGLRLHNPRVSAGLRSRQYVPALRGWYRGVRVLTARPGADRRLYRAPGLPVTIVTICSSIVWARERSCSRVN